MNKNDNTSDLDYSKTKIYLLLKLKYFSME
jgi:hypothetical protein